MNTKKGPSGPLTVDELELLATLSNRLLQSFTSDRNTTIDRLGESDRRIAQVACTVWAYCNKELKGPRFATVEEMLPFLTSLEQGK